MDGPGPTLCGFDVAWVGLCDKEEPCAAHGSLKCCSCGNRATHDCPETMSLMCGAPLCDDCHHVQIKGITGPTFTHGPKEAKS